MEGVEIRAVETRAIRLYGSLAEGEKSGDRGEGR